MLWLGCVLLGGALWHPTTASLLPKSTREFVSARLSSAVSLIGCFAAPSIATAVTTLNTLPIAPKKAIRPYLYSVEFTDPPCLLPRTKIGEGNTIKRLCQADMVLLGEHGRIEDDKSLAVDILKRMVQTKPKDVVLGLEMVEQPFQSALDDYSSSTLSLEEADSKLFEATQWNTRWKFSFEPYLQLLHFAKKNSIPLVALGAPTETVTRVQSEGFDAITDSERNAYITDAEGFVEFVRLPGFKRFSDKVILPSYAFYVSNNLLGKDPSPEKFFASRIFKDEAIAGKAAQYLANRDGTTLVALLGMEHCKFGYGVQERTKYRLAKLRGQPPPIPLDEDMVSTKRLLATVGSRNDVLSVLLNPSAKDSTSQTTQLALSLAYGINLPECRPLSDYIWFSDYPELKLLTRPKNPINNEGEKPPGESSIIGAF